MFLKYSNMHEICLQSSINNRPTPNIEKTGNAFITHKALDTNFLFNIPICLDTVNAHQKTSIF